MGQNECFSTHKSTTRLFIWEKLSIDCITGKYLPTADIKM